MSTTPQPTSYVSYLHAQSMPIVGRPVLVLTFDAYLTNVNYSEAFVFMEGRDSEAFCGLRWCADPRDLASVGSPREILEERARIWAHSEVDHRAFSGQPPRVVLPPWDWKPATRQVLLDLWIRGKFSDPIKTTCAASKSEAFRNDVQAFMHLRPGMLRSEDM